MALAIVPYPKDPRYGVTRDGKVFRIERSPRGRPVPFEMRQRADKDGYRLVGATMKVHRLVAETFIPNPRKHPWVAHENGIRWDNRVGNLAWKSVRDNHLDKRRHGTANNGVKHPEAKLTDALVREARRRAGAGETHASIAAGMPVDRSVLSRAIRRETWAHV